MGHSWQAGSGHGSKCGGKSIHWPRTQHQSLFYDSWQHNYYCQQRQAGWVNKQSMYMRCLWKDPTENYKTVYLGSLLYFHNKVHEHFQVWFCFGFWLLVVLIGLTEVAGSRRVKRRIQDSKWWKDHKPIKVRSRWVDAICSTYFIFLILWTFWQKVLRKDS